MRLIYASHALRAKGLGFRVDTGIQPLRHKTQRERKGQERDESDSKSEKKT